jgi:amino acid transporter
MASGVNRDEQPQVLKQNAMGLAGIVFFVVAAAAPLTITVGDPGLTFGLGGTQAAALGFLIAGIVLLLFSVGYATMSTHIKGPGGFSVFAEMAFGRRAGAAIAYVALVGYASIMCGVYGFFGYLAQYTFSGIGLDLPWWAWIFACIALVGIIGHRSIDLSTKVLSVLLVCEVVIVLYMDIAILAQGGDSGISFVGFSPSELIHGAAPGILLLFAIGGFTGYEATTIYSEEARDRKRTIPRAMYLAVIVITVFYVFTFWAQGVGYGDNVIAAATNSPGTFTFDLMGRYAGAWGVEVTNWLVLTSVFACLLAFHNSLARYLFSAGRAGLVSRRLGRSHPRHESPYTANLFAVAIAVVVVGVCALLQVDPYLFMWGRFCGVGCLSMLLLYASGSFSVIGYLHFKRIDTRPWQTLIAPIAGGAGLLVMVYLALSNFASLTGSTNFVENLLLALLPFIGAGIGYIVAVVRRDTLPLADVSLEPSGERVASAPSAEPIPVPELPIQ